MSILIIQGEVIISLILVTNVTKWAKPNNANISHNEPWCRNCVDLVITQFLDSFITLDLCSSYNILQFLAIPSVGRRVQQGEVIINAYHSWIGTWWERHFCIGSLNACSLQNLCHCCWNVFRMTMTGGATYWWCWPVTRPGSQHCTENRTNENVIQNKNDWSVDAIYN